MSAQPFQRLSLQIRFDTPAFLGDAEQSGAWRTPPFKALLRQWWRVLAAQACGYDVRALRERERELFGGVFGDGEEQGRRSAVRLRLAEWRGGVQEGLPSVGTVGKPPADPLVYLGYGPVNTQKRRDGKGREFVVRRYLKPETDRNVLRLIAPEAHARTLLDVLQCVAWFGTVGSRSRNGWGSLRLDDLQVAGTLHAAEPYVLCSATGIRQGAALLKAHALPFRTALQRDWPHAFGCDDHGGLLIWRTASKPYWADAMRELALAKQAFRRAVPAARRGFGRRHLLAYPVTKQIVEEWKADRNKDWDEARFANQLRFKVHKLGDGYAGYAFHIPCGLPQPLLARLSRTDQRIVAEYEADDWGQVHAALDRVMQRID